MRGNKSSHRDLQSLASLTARRATAASFSHFFQLAICDRRSVRSTGLAKFRFRRRAGCAMPRWQEVDLPNQKTARSRSARSRSCSCRGVRIGMPEDEDFGQAVGRRVAEFHAGIDRRELCECENGAPKILPGPTPSFPEPTRRPYACRLGCRKPSCSSEDWGSRVTIALEHVLEGPKQRVGSCFLSSGSSSFKLIKNSRICSQAGKFVQHPVGELLAGLAAKLDLRLHTPDGEQEERRRQSFAQPFTAACRVRG